MQPWRRHADTVSTTTTAQNPPNPRSRS